MKKIITLLFLLLFAIANSQVQDLPIAFAKKGYVLAIDIEQKMIQIDFFTIDKNLGDEEVLRSEVFTLSNCELVNDKKGKITLNDLRSSDEVQVDGQWFQDKNEYNIQKITLQSKFTEDQKEGRVDLINNNFAYVDGNKIKLAEGKKIKGDDKSGYKGLTKNSFNEIKEGIYASVEGKYDNSGCFLAKNFTISPDLETSFDKAAFAADKEMYDEIYPIWIDPAKRRTFYGKNIIGLGKITNNDEVQDYINKVGQKLIPEHIKLKKKNFIFIVVDNPDLLAYVKPNGLAFICSGLLFNLENEAQLAVVLGHEISHAIYEHQAGEEIKKVKKEKEASKFGSLFNKVTAIGNKALDIKKGVEGYQSTESRTAEVILEEQAAELERKKQREKNQQLLKEGVETTTSLYHDKKISEFSIDQEYQADRVGLCLAVLAGYDPREAPIVWKSIYEKYGVITNDKEKAAIVEKQIEAIRKEDIENGNKTYNVGGLTTQAINGLMTIKQIDYKAKSVKTHPDEIKRYQVLNKLVALYWNDSALLEKAINNEEGYRKMLKELVKASKVETPTLKTITPPKTKKNK